MQAKEFKVMVLGPPCGKTTFLQHLQHQKKNFSKKYRPTLGVSVHPYEVGYIGRCKYRLNMYEVGSQYPGLGSGYCTGAAMAIIFSRCQNDTSRYEAWLPPNIPRIRVSNYTVENTPEILANVEEIILGRVVKSAL